MKLAFLFLTGDNHHQPAVWQAFFDAAEAEHYSIYCHPKFPERVIQPFLRANMIAEPIETRHGDISLVRAFLLLLRAAVADADNQYFILLSESCVPLYGFATLERHLLGRRASWISYGFDGRWENIERWRQLKPGFVSLDGFRKQHQWVVLHRDAVKVLLAHDYTALFETMYAPDEHYVVNVLAQCGVSLEDQVHNVPPTFVNWEDYEVTREGTSVVKLRPYTYDSLTVEDVLYARSNGCLFMRKVSTSCDCSALQAANDPWGPSLLSPVTRTAFFSVIMLASADEQVMVPSLDDGELLVEGKVVPRSARAVPSGANMYETINQALAMTHGEWIHILPAGHEVTPEFYPRMRAALQDCPASVAVAFCRYTLVTDDGQCFQPVQEGSESGVLEPDWLAGLLEGNPLHLSAVLFRRGAFETIGLFGADIPYCADWEWYLRSAITQQWWYQADRMVTCRPSPVAASIQNVANEHLRSTRLRAAIHYHAVHPDQSLPWGLWAESSNFMTPETPDGLPSPAGSGNSQT